MLFTNETLRTAGILNYIILKNLKLFHYKNSINKIMMILITIQYITMTLFPYFLRVQFILLHLHAQQLNPHRNE